MKKWLFEKLVGVDGLVTIEIERVKGGRGIREEANGGRGQRDGTGGGRVIRVGLVIRRWMRGLLTRVKRRRREGVYSVCV